jgi:hypothetical protein
MNHHFAMLFDQAFKKGTWSYTITIETIDDDAVTAVANQWREIYL